MKKTFFVASIIALLCAACSNDKDTDSNLQKEKVSLTITLAGSKHQPRAVGAPTQAEENAIHGFTVYVFSGNTIEVAQTFASSTLTQTINGLTTGTKRVVVVANAPATFPTFVMGDAYSVFAAPANYINLDDQQSLTNGLMMTGEDEVTLAAAPATNSVTIPISRIVAKIQLGTITIDASAGNNPALFALEAVAIVKAPSLSSVGIPSIVTTPPLYSGVEGMIVHPPFIRSYLFEPITTTDFAERYFYVFANEGTGDNATLMTLIGTYNGVIMYYPFRIDPIEQNTQHTINITLRRLGSGSPDPEIPSDPATLDVTITPEDWVVVPVQNEEW